MLILITTKPTRYIFTHFVITWKWAATQSVKLCRNFMKSIKMCQSEIWGAFIPMATSGSPAAVAPVMKSPIRAGRSYTQLGNTGLGWVGFFLLCLSLSIFRVTSADCKDGGQVEELTDVFNSSLLKTIWSGPLEVVIRGGPGVFSDSRP